MLLAREAGTSPRARLVGLSIYHVGVFVGLRALLAYALRESPGVAFTLQTRANLEAVARPDFYVKTFAPLVPVLILVFYRWREKPPFLRRASFVLGAPLILLCLLFGSLGEMRTYLELYPFAFLLAVPSVVHAFGWTDLTSLPRPPNAGAQGGTSA